VNEDEAGLVLQQSGFEPIELFFAERSGGGVEYRVSF
jgi:hypothetical protein